jgi:hypothetical protein
MAVFLAYSYQLALCGEVQLFVEISTEHINELCGPLLTVLLAGQKVAINIRQDKPNQKTLQIP